MICVHLGTTFKALRNGMARWFRLSNVPRPAGTITRPIGFVFDENGGNQPQVAPSSLRHNIYIMEINGVSAVTVNE
nr:unnamed protein product [Callosobruchus chinensis]